MQTLPRWIDVACLRADVLSEDFSEDVFALDLGPLADGNPNVPVYRDPVRARLVRLPWRYPWSSAAVHTRRAEPTGLLEAPEWRREMSPKEWEEVLRGTDDEEMVRLLRIRTQTGRPLASDRFMSKVEAFLGRRVRPLPVGRQHGWRNDKTRGKGKYRVTVPY